MMGMVWLWSAAFIGCSLRCAAAPGVPSQAATDPVAQYQDAVAQFQGQMVRHITYEGIAAGRLSTLKLPQTAGKPLDRENLAASLRQLYSTGLFATVEAAVRRDPDGITVVFRGTARMFIGTVSVTGAKGATINTQLERATRLIPGLRLTDARMKQALAAMKQVLEQNGYYEPKIGPTITPHPEDMLSDIAFQVVSGPKARVGTVVVSGDSGLSLEEFRRLAHLRPGAAVDRETASRALAGVLKHYRKEKRLEAEIKVDAEDYAAHKVNYRFTANRGPVVKVAVEGASLSEERIKHLVPVFEEGAVDDDLLNEGNRRIRDYFQSLGYFDVKVEHQTTSSNPGDVLVAYHVNLGNRRKVERVSVAGNKYFNSSTLKEMLNVQASSTLDRNGIYSQALVAADVAALEAAYQNNGFSEVKVTPEVSSGATDPSSGGVAGAGRLSAPVVVVYHVDEGRQQRVGSVRFEGNDHASAEALQRLINTEPGQLLSPRNLAGDRDALATDYLGRGFSQVRVEVEEKTSAGDPATADVVFHITEGTQFFVRNVLMTGLHYTRTKTVEPAITLHPGDPLSQTELEQTQRNLYEFALFNEINLAVQNPNGTEARKTVLLQAAEARRWTFTYGGGFEVQTGTPVNGCQGYIASGVACTPSGRTGISPRLLAALTRNNLFGREQSASVLGNYGLLEQKVDLVYQNQRLFGNRKFGLTFTGGYANSQDVTTYVASRLVAGFRLKQSYSGAGNRLLHGSTFIYAYDFRRVKVAEESLQVFPDFVPVLAAAVRVGGPSFTWLRDTRDSPVDSHRGSYTSFQDFVSAAPFGAEAFFHRIDTTYSSYYGFDKGKWVLARNTRYGQERAFGSGNSELLPLPERLYAGGATSLRGFSVNAAGPRDPDTGFPIGGAGALVNSVELRLPPPSLPLLGNALSVVLFHDMGNIFNNAGDIWSSALRVRQPNRDACKQLTPPIVDPTTGKETLPYPDGPTYSTGPTRNCSFNFFAHAPGLGLRYHTPVGPIRLDFSYNLNPPIYPINVDYSKTKPFENQHVGEAIHFNFFFSLGQTF